MPVRFYESLCLTADDALSEAEAARRTSFVRVDQDQDGAPRRAVIVEKGAVTRLVLFDVPDPDPERLAPLRHDHGALPVTVIGPVQLTGTGSSRMRWEIDEHGEVVSRQRAVLSAGDRLEAEHHLDAEGRVTWTIRYTYGDDGALVSIAEVAPDGRVVSQDDVG